MGGIHTCHAGAQTGIAYVLPDFPAVAQVMLCKKRICRITVAQIPDFLAHLAIEQFTERIEDDSLLLVRAAHGAVSTVLVLLHIIVVEEYIAVEERSLTDDLSEEVRYPGLIFRFQDDVGAEMFIIQKCGGGAGDVENQADIALFAPVVHLCRIANVDGINGIGETEIEEMLFLQLHHAVKGGHAFVESFGHAADFFMNIAETIETDADSHQDVVLVAVLDDRFRQCQNSLCRETIGIDRGFFEPRHICMAGFDDIREILPQERLAAANAQRRNFPEQSALQTFLQFIQGQVLIVRPQPVITHYALGITAPGNVINHRSW